MNENGSQPAESSTAPETLRNASRSEVPVSRRQFVAGIGPSIVGTVGLQGLSPSKVELVVARDYDGPARIERVPEAWWEHVRAKRNAVVKLRETLTSKPGVKRVGDGPSSRQIEGFKAYKVVVEVTGQADLSAIPSSVNGVRVETKSFAPGVPLHAGCYNNHDYSDIPGGAIASAKSDATPYGSLYAPVGYESDTSNEPYMATANHVMKVGSDGCGSVGNAVYQPENRMGEVIYANQDHDWALIYNDGESETYDGTILHPSNGRYCIDSWFTKDGADYLHGSGETVTAVGASTGATTGQVESTSAPVGNVGACYTADNGIQVSCRSASGDSGGPVFQIDSSTGKVILLSMANEGVPGYENGTECGATAYDRIDGIAQWDLDKNFGIQPFLDCPF